MSAAPAAVAGGGTHGACGRDGTGWCVGGGGACAAGGGAAAGAASAASEGRREVPRQGLLYKYVSLRDQRTVFVRVK